MKTAVHIVLWLFVGALLVLIVKNGKGFATAVTAIDTPVLQGAQILSGGNPTIKAAA